jgi:vitamin B12 transporter
VWYDTEEALKVPDYQPNGNWITRKKPFWVFNYYGEVDVSDSFTVYAGVNNILNKNQHPLFLAIDDGTPYLTASNGGTGTSMPGREFYLGVKFNF